VGKAVENRNRSHKTSVATEPTKVNGQQLMTFEWEISQKSHTVAVNRIAFKTIQDIVNKKKDIICLSRFLKLKLQM